MRYFTALLLVLIAASFAEVAITVYSDGFALVKDKRSIEVPKGIVPFDYSPVPSKIRPQTVRFDAKTLTVLEQNYEYDVVSTARLLEKNIDNEVTLKMENGDTYSGKLLSSDSQTVLLGIAGSLVSIRLSQVVNVSFPLSATKIYTHPTLSWLLRSDSPDKVQTELSYMTDGVDWDAAYVATVNKDDTRLTLDGWVTIDNTCGMTFDNATLKLVAGKVHRVQEERYMPRAKGMLAADMTEVAAGFEQEAFFEYHLYSLPRPATVADRQNKQLSLFETARTEAKKKFIFENARGKDVRVEMEFMNSKEKGLGMPLPEGIIRVYKEDASGALQFIGEDKIEHTPKDEKVRVYLGNAFDIVANRDRVNYSRISDRSYDEEYSIKIRNHKEEAVTVTVVEHFWGDWFIKSENIKGNKKDSRTNEWELSIPKDGETTLNYTVRYR